MIRFILLLLLLLVFTGCGKEESPAEPPTQAEPLAVAVEQDELAIPVEAEPLPPLETGLVELRDDVFGEIIELKGKSRPINEVFLTKETEMLIKDGYLVHKALPQAGWPVFNIFSLPELKRVKSFGVMGEGPGEFVSPSIGSTETPGKMFCIYESRQKTLSSVDSQFRLKQKGFTIPLSGLVWSDMLMHCFSENELFFVAAYLPRGMEIHNARFEAEEVIDKKIHDLSFSPKYKAYSAFSGVFAASKKNQRLVYAYKSFKRIVFMDPTGSEVRTVFFKRPEPPAGNSAEMLSPANVTHYWKISSGEKYVYISYSGRTPIHVFNENKIDKGYIYIEQFDWNGNPVRKFRLDHWGYFCVDEKNDKLYLVSSTEDEPFVEYDLPPLVDKTAE